MKPEYVEQYKKLNPLEKNNTLLELFQQIPQSLHEQLPNREDWRNEPGKGKGIDEKARRRNSESIKILVDRTESLLLFSPTTIPFRAFLAENYEGWYVRGLPQQFRKEELFDGILFKDYQTNPGIFAQPSGKEIERAIYRAEKMELLRMRSLFQQAAEEEGLEFTDKPSIPIDRIWAIFHANSKEIYTVPEKYMRDIEQAMSIARQQRTTIESWSNEFFKKYGEEI